MNANKSHGNQDDDVDYYLNKVINLSKNSLIAQT